MFALSQMFVLAQQNSAQQSGSGAGILFVLVIELGLVVLAVAGIWTTFSKAGRPGWAAIVPFYNAIVLLQVANLPLWFFILYFVPFLNLAIIIYVGIKVAQAFGKGIGFGIGLGLLPFIFYPILGFGSATYGGGAQAAA